MKTLENYYGQQKFQKIKNIKQAEIDSDKTIKMVAQI